jgi:hypothetical protein
MEKLGLQLVDPGGGDVVDGHHLQQPLQIKKSHCFDQPTILISSSVKVLSMTVSLPPLGSFCTSCSVFPSTVMTLLTFLPSGVSWSNSTPGLNLSTTFLNVEVEVRVYSSPSLFNSATGETALPILRVTRPTPANRPVNK